VNVWKPDFKKRGGLVIVIAQELHPDGRHGRVLMQAYTNEAGYLETLATGKAVYWSTSRNERWCKGETSGNVQKVRDILIDCDGDCLIYLIIQEGEGACHTDAHSCFYRCVNAFRSLLMPAPRAGEKEQLETIDVPVEPALSERLQ
jgi:phosphoribosyl-AMP cyclohydrolase